MHVGCLLVYNVAATITHFDIQDTICTIDVVEHSVLCFIQSVSQILHKDRHSDKSKVKELTVRNFSERMVKRFAHFKDAN